MSENNLYTDNTSKEPVDPQNNNTQSEQSDASNPFRKDWKPEDENSNLALGILGGLSAALIGAIIWAGITVLTGYQFSIAAAGMRFLVGGAVRLLGKGWDSQYRIAGAVLSMLGCLLGNIFSIYAIIADELNVSFFQVLATTGIAKTIQYLQLTFGIYDILFYGIALVVSYKISAKDY